MGDTLYFQETVDEILVLYSLLTDLHDVSGCIFTLIWFLFLIFDTEPSATDDMKLLLHV